MQKSKVIVVMPAYNAEKTLEKTFNAIPKDWVDEVIVVDDASKDKTRRIVEKLKLPLFQHKENTGYGGNQKTCYLKALERGADIVIMLHPDYQYDPGLIPLLIEPLRLGLFDLMLGSRMQSRKETLKGGMPVYKYIANRCLTLLENIVLGLNLSEYHTGYRAYTRKVLVKVPFEQMSDDFVFDQQFLISSHALGFRIGEIAVPTKYFPEASSINLTRSTIYGIGVVVELVKYILGVSYRN